MNELKRLRFGYQLYRDIQSGKLSINQASILIAMNYRQSK